MALMVKKVSDINYYKNVKYSNDVITVDRVYENCYVAIRGIDGDKCNLRLTVSFYQDGNQVPVKVENYRFTPSVADGSDNFIRQGYEYLKTLPEFAGAADC